jgi:hypothetical protein
MRNTLPEAPPPPTLLLTLADLPPYPVTQNNRPRLAIAAYLRRLLERHHTEAGAPFLLIPGIHRLADFFKCPEVTLYEALADLERMGYEYGIRTQYGPVCLRDPRNRRPVQHRANLGLHPEGTWHGGRYPGEGFSLVSFPEL